MEMESRMNNWNRKCVTQGCDGIAHIYSSYCFECKMKRLDIGKEEEECHSGLD